MASPEEQVPGSRNNGGDAAAPAASDADTTRTTENETTEENNDTSVAAATSPHSDDNNNQRQSALAGVRPLDALHSRLVSRQRSNILLQVLFHHMLTSRRRREEEEDIAVNPPPLPDRPMPVLSHEEALSSQAICRFCFETSVEGEDDHNNNSLVAPCNCSGGSRWVHLQCLRQWQSSQARNTTLDDSSTTYTAAGYICNVCNSPYLSRPPAVQRVRVNLLRRGTLLVSKQTTGRTFHQTVILLLNDVIGGAFGLIINSPLSESARMTTDSTQIMNTHPEGGQEEQQSYSIEWRRGGPVCGGRLGVVQCIILHTFPPNWFLGQGNDVLDVDIDEDYFEDEAIDIDEGNAVIETESESDIENDNDNNMAVLDPNEEPETDDEDDDISPLDADDERCAPLSLPIFDLARSNPPIQFVASPETQVPATFSEESLRHILPRIVNPPLPKMTILRMDQIIVVMTMAMKRH